MVAVRGSAQPSRMNREIKRLSALLPGTRLRLVLLGVILQSLEETLVPVNPGFRGH